MNRKLKLAVLGDPVEHSLSPAMHEAAMRRCGLSGSYERIEVTTSDLKECVESLAWEGYSGFNVTVPHKRQMVGLLDGWDETVRRIGATNTAVRHPQGWFGYNTDVTGLARLVADLDTGPNHAVVLGAGGAARACVEALLQSRWQVTVANRTLRHAAEAFEAPVEIIPLSPSEELRSACATASLLINATSAGMNRAAESPLPDRDYLVPRPIVMDLVYVPLDTKLLRDAREAGCRTIDGLSLLAAQAADSFELWTGERLADSFFRVAAETALHATPIDALPGSHGPELPTVGPIS